MASSNGPEQACLTDFDLRRYCAGEMSADAHAATRDHLADCAGCAQRAEALRESHNSWIDQLREIGAPPGNAPTLQPAASAQLPRQIAGYEIEEEIGRGGQGVVFRAVQRSTKRHVALKVLREGPLASPASHRRFEREIELVAGLRHPRIVTVFDSGITNDGQRWCAMDFVSGTRLDDYVRGKRLTVSESLELMAKICEAVSHAHQRGIIHRDLKPSNVLVDENGEPNVLDFGLARHEGETEDTLVTAPSVIAGTLPYLSPEQVRGHRADIDIRSDVYALGVMLYEMLTGRYPYDVTGSVQQILTNITDAPPASPSRTSMTSQSSSELKRRIDNEIETIVLKTLSKESDRRYQSAGELARDLRRYLAGEPVEAKRDSNWYLIRKAVQRNKLPAAGLATLALVITIASIALAVMYDRQSRLLDEVRRQQAAAQKAEARATRRFDEVRELARAFIFELEPKVKHLVGSTEVRAFIVRRGLAYLDNLEAEAGDDSALIADLGAAYFRIGDIQGDPQLPNLGDPEGALESYKKGLEHLETYAAFHQDDKKTQARLLNAHLRMASLLRAMRRPAESDASFKKTTALMDELLEKYPDDKGLLRNLTNTNDHIADSLVASGKCDEAIDLYQQSLFINEKRFGKDALQRDLIVSYYKLGDAHLAKGDAKSALSWYAKYVERMQLVLEENQNSALVRDDLGWGYERLAYIHQLLGDMPASILAARNGLDMHKTVAAADPHHLRAHNGVRAAYCRIGEAQLAMGQLEAAGESFLQFRDKAEEIASRQPDRPAAQRERAVAAYKSSELARKLAELPNTTVAQQITHLNDARRHLEDCLGIFNTMKDAGMLSASDSAVPQALTAEMEACAARIQELEAGSLSHADKRAEPTPAASDISPTPN